METFSTGGKKNFKPKSSFEIESNSVKQRLQQCIDQGMSKYEIAMKLPPTLKQKEGIEEKVTRYYIRQHFE